ncbi:hypothetical protein HOLleu_16818 [Holothuria leucospilota]|uniref:BRICHOS domain-containing protein n=1 Tax=Holothuria leucospilota TaxID=206669 RepID=A0A9Q1HBH2_HOLLE|nr:hypothetical protein HOLleu_16818 [Holothuria leucospilota]
MLKWCSFYVFTELLVVYGALALPVDEEPLAFEFDGIQHFETRTVSEDIVILTDVQDEFVLTLDYGRNIFLINNLKTNACYFSRLENVPINKDDHVPVLVVGEDRQNEADVVFTPSGTIPYNYVHLTNDITVAEQCISKPSYWLEMEDGGRQRRSDDCRYCLIFCICYIC